MLEERLRLGPGFGDTDRVRVMEALKGLEKHLASFRPDQVELEASVKDRDTRQQRVTLQAWIAGWPHLVAVEPDRDLGHALAEVRRELIRQIDEEKEKRFHH